MLIEACSLPREPGKISQLVAEVRNFDSLFLLAEEHGVIAHLANALGEISARPAASAFLDSLRARHRIQLLFTLTMTAELFRILELFRQAKVETVLVKGPVLSLRAYGDPAARQYVDLDLIVRHVDISKTAEVLLAAGYQSRVPAEAIRAGKIPGEYLFRRPGTQVIFELHTERTFRYYPRPLPVEKYFSNKIALQLDGQPVPALSAEDEFVLISIHGAKHFWERLMWISDIAAMIYNCPDLDWQRIQQSASDVGAERMVRIALLLAESLLRVPIPEAMKREVAADAACASIVASVAAWLPFAGSAAPPLARRALFRFQMRGSVFAGVGYLARLSFSTTEDDWSADATAPQSRFLEMLRRPFRLAKKYRRDPD